VTLTTNGIDLHYDIAGDGEPLLWLHGYFGIGDDWRHVFGYPPRDYRVIAPDLRGHGRSTNPLGTFTFRACAGDVCALLDHLQIDSVKAIGLSGGGIALLHLAAAAPDRVSAMVVVSAPTHFPEQAGALQRQSSFTAMSEAEQAGFRARHPQGDAQIERLFAACRAFADDRDDVAFTAEQLGRIAAETLIVFGDRDPLYPVSIACDLYAAIPRAWLWVVPNGAHGPIFGAQARPFAETALAFLNGAWRQPAA
jgi:pimeloyl-ACP methyl ester carboxylesterase